MSDKYILEKQSSSQKCDTVWFPKTTKDLLTDANGKKLTDMILDEEAAKNIVKTDANAATKKNLKDSLRISASTLITKEALKEYLRTNFIEVNGVDVLLTNLQQKIGAGPGFSIENKCLKAKPETLPIYPIFLTSFKLKTPNPNVGSTTTELPQESVNFIANVGDTWEAWLNNGAKSFLFENGVVGTITATENMVQISIPNRVSEATPTYTYSLYREEGSSWVAISPKDLITANTNFEFR